MVLHTQGRVQCTDNLIKVTASLLSPRTISPLRQRMLAVSASNQCLREKVPSAPAAFLPTAALDPLSRRRANSIQATVAPSEVCPTSSADHSRDTPGKANLCINSTGSRQPAMMNRKNRTVSSKVRAERTLYLANPVARVQQPTCPVNPVNPVFLHHCLTRISRRLGVIQAI